MYFSDIEKDDYICQFSLHLVTFVNMLHRRTLAYPQLTYYFESEKFLYIFCFFLWICLLRQSISLDISTTKSAVLTLKASLQTRPLTFTITTKFVFRPTLAIIYRPYWAFQPPRIVPYPSKRVFSHKCHLFLCYLELSSFTTWRYST